MNMNDYIIFYQLFFEEGVTFPENVNEKSLAHEIMNEAYKEIEGGKSTSFNKMHNKIKFDIIESLTEYFILQEEYEKCAKLQKLKKFYERNGSKKEPSERK